MTPETRLLRGFLIADSAVASLSVPYVMVVWASTGCPARLLVLSVLVVACSATIASGLRPLARGAPEVAVRRLAGANWATSLAATAIVPFAWPILAFATLLPVVAAVPHVGTGSLRGYLAPSLVSTCLVVLIGLNVRSATVDQLPGWVPVVSNAVFVPFMGALLLQLALVSQAHLHKLLDAEKQANDELRRSQSRIVSAADGERRRIARDLHDGAQQHLTALEIGLSIASRLEAPPELERQITGLRASAAEARRDLRRLVHGIYPAALTEHGLRTALAGLASSAGLPVAVDARKVRRHDPEVEAAVYFCCLEAVQNSTRHGGRESRATITVTDGAGGLRFEVADTGCGFDPGSVTAGGGFVGMRDRVEALGGELVILGEPGVGTRVVGALPEGSLAVEPSLGASMGPAPTAGYG